MYAYIHARERTSERMHASRLQSQIKYWNQQEIVQNKQDLVGSEMVPFFWFCTIFLITLNRFFVHFKLCHLLFLSCFRFCGPFLTHTEYAMV